MTVLIKIKKKKKIAVKRKFENECCNGTYGPFGFVISKSAI
jgi:hypothetical protein